jgi:phage-related tail protein
LGQERDRLRVNVKDLVAGTNRLKSVARSKTQEVDDLRAELARLRGELRPRNREREVRLTRGDLAVANGRGDGAEADRLTAQADLSELRKTPDLRRILRDSQEKCRTMEKELDSLREGLGRKRSELDVLRGELARETETSRALKEQGDRSKICLQIEEAKQAQDAELKRRHPYSHEHMEHMREKCGSWKGTPSHTRTRAEEGEPTSTSMIIRC